MQLNYIANARVPSSSGRSLAVVDPSDGQPFEDIPRSNAHDIDDAVAAARDGFDGVWRNLAATERGRLLARWSALLGEHAGELAATLQNDCGKPTRQALADVHALVACLAAHAEACGAIATDPVPARAGYRTETWHDPHGVTAHLIPWYAPLQCFGRGVGAALAAGNVCVVKPSEEASLALLRVAELAGEAGLPPGALNIVTGYDHEAGDALARHRGVDHISFTGAPALGTLVRQAAAERHCPVRLDLGDKRLHIVCADADLDAAVPAILAAVLHSAAQSRAAGARLLIEEAVYEPLLERLANAFDDLRVGPAAIDLDMGPLISHAQQQRVWDFLSDAQVAGIPVLAQGVVVDDAPETGFYQAPTLLRDVPLAQAIALEDVPGPVLAAMAFQGDAEAITLANATLANVVTSLWTRDALRPQRLARSLRSGHMLLNHHEDHPGPRGPAEALGTYTTRKTLAVRLD
ncbi:MAG: aldehyde dehydrogenase family protein [Rhodoferax sp.]|nr:aldehyde dehydrogenase family protein [Rhodoferax sp.]